MNPYARLASGSGASSASALAARLTGWHDAMVTHERRLRTGRSVDVCGEECPHAEARTLWAEALAVFGERAYELSFLRSRAASVAPPAGDPRSRPVVSPSRPPQHMGTEAEL